MKPALTAPYSGPHKVLERKEKNFLLLINNKKVIVSIDRLKPAHLLPGDSSRMFEKRADKSSRASEETKTDTNVEQNIPTSIPDCLNNSPVKCTRSGRRVHFPKNLNQYITY